MEKEREEQNVWGDPEIQNDVCLSNKTEKHYFLQHIENNQ